MTCWALIAVKSRAAGKLRLAPVLPVNERIQLVQDMLAHVLVTAQQCKSIDRVAVVSPERSEIPEGVTVVADAGNGINEALTGGLQTLTQQGATRVVILPADLPWVTPTDLDELVHAGEQAGLAIAPDRRELGTNGLCLTLPSTFQTRFGNNSFALHRAEAARLGQAPAIVRTHGLAFDIDEPEDLAHLTQIA